ncbi:MAG: alpha/beta hydrolase [Chloroflexi bacterium]|nr:alpha/beta hydrolase [Chloroflexota bacterium]MBK7177728.1 alpha/beta hydrolase [Chloroflexota bacterium]MBK8935677.1 alpha/beta hydrolase [Chloroflexota bacterium]
MTLQKTKWHAYETIYHGYHTVTGTLKVTQGILSPRLRNRRDIFVYLPPSYAHSDRRYPVLYMHDGQNLFDNALSFAGEWRVDETMERLAYEQQLEAIVVGIPNMGQHRMDEYSPFHHAGYGGGKGDEYLGFIVHTLKPLIDQDFRTLPDKRHTGIMGSSMGGLISLYAFFAHTAVFGFAGVMSPSLWFADYAMLAYVGEAEFNPGRLYLDAGTREYGDANHETTRPRTQSRRYYASVRRLKRILVNKGYRPQRDLLHVEEKWAAHNEAAWERRLPSAIEFFLRDKDYTNGTGELMSN